MDEAAGSRLGQFQLCEVIRRGKLSTVYKASQPALRRFVALKVLHPAADPQLAARFQLEAEATARLAHPNILPVYDYGQQDGCFYLATQYIEGGATLADSLGVPMDPPTAVQLASRLLDALHHAHQRGVVHRDVKPTNILMASPTWPLLADFGIAKLVARREDPQLTQQGFVVGTAAYMAPEQALGLPIDARTDVYALGVVLYEMVTGRVPFDADTPTAALARHAYEPPPPPRTLAPGLPAPLEAVLLRALAKEPSGRYQTAAAMREALERLDEEHADPSSMRLASLYAPAVEAFSAGHWDVAVEWLERVLALDPDHEDAHELLAAARQARATSTAPALVPTPPQAPRLAPAAASGAPCEAPRPLTTAGEREPAVSAAPDRASWHDRLLVCGAALLLLAASLVALGEHRPSAYPPDAPTSLAGASPGSRVKLQARSPGAVPAPSQPGLGRLRFSDGAGSLDVATLTATHLPTPPEGMRYEAWLLATPTNQRRSIGLIHTSLDGNAIAALATGGSNLLASFDALEITVEPDPDTNRSPSGDVVLRSALPPNALAHIRNLLVSFDGTPGRVSLTTGLLQATGAAQRESGRMLDARDAGDLDRMRRHAEALVNLIDGPAGPRYGDRDGDGVVTGAGDGFGLSNSRRVGYLRAVQREARLAADAPDATPNITAHAGYVVASAERLARWTAQLRDLCLTIAAAESIDQVHATVDQATTLAARLLTDPEAGAKTVYQHTQYLADLLIAR